MDRGQAVAFSSCRRLLVVWLATRLEPAVCVYILYLGRKRDRTSGGPAEATLPRAGKEVRIPHRNR